MLYGHAIQSTFYVMYIIKNKYGLNIFLRLLKFKDLITIN